MVADSLAPGDARISAAMMLIMQDRQVLVLLKEDISTTCVLSMWRNEMQIYVYIISEKNST